MPRLGWPVRGLLLCATAWTLATALAAVSWPAAHPVTGWAALHRPLHLPKLRPGASCPVSRVDTRVEWRGAHIFGVSGVGPGPVYPGLGYRHGRLLAGMDVQFGGPWSGEKVFWYVRPGYRGPVLIRGRRLEGRELLGFDGERQPDRELRIRAGETVSWQGQPAGSRGVPSDVRVRRAGCYGIQIDGTSFSHTVVIRATLVQ